MRLDQIVSSVAHVLQCWHKYRVYRQADMWLLAGTIYRGQRSGSLL